VNELNARASQLLDIARREHVPLTALHHALWWFRTGGAFQEHDHASACPRDSDLGGAERWLQFTRARRETQIQIRENGFEVRTAADGVTLLVDGVANLKVDGAQRALTSIAMLGRTYRAITLPRGTFMVTAAP
jgi:hypothetical protein